ncbi:MurR/RpiR family transcriptional regulator [Paenibacillus humicola]|uniref:MurR/RpiR family transcriptional regulator n=1 Tax=Paenibacillus humicola TaxID=3110540 RepID=UPI00237C13E1|nr:MurR/RpiR family transcriptional regulator [Paenibacillus humicola]
MNGGLVRLREIMNDITPSERKVAEYIIAHPEELVSMSVAELSRHSEGSQAAVIRLCKSAGFKGYQELKLKVAGDLQQSGGNSGYQEINPNDSIDRIIENVSNNNIQSIRDTMKILKPAHVAKAVEALQRAKRIYFFGIGASNLIAADAQYKFTCINKTSLCFEDPHTQLISSVMTDKDDVAVGISYSGESRSTVECVRRAREQGATTISISRYGNTSLSQAADIPLFISSTENEIRSGSTSSRITQLNVIDILYLGVASRDYDQSVNYLEKRRNIVKLFR